MNANAAVSRLVDEFGAQVVVGMRVPIASTRIATLDLIRPARAGTKLRDSVLRVLGADVDEVVHFDGLPRGTTGLFSRCDKLHIGYVLLLGAHATALWRPDVQLTRAAGRMYGWKSRLYVYPMLHMNAVLRGTITLAQWRAQLAEFLDLRETPTPLTQPREACLLCGKGVFILDADAVPWCREHYSAHIKRSLKPAQSNNQQLTLGTGND